MKHGTGGSRTAAPTPGASSSTDPVPQTPEEASPVTLAPPTAAGKRKAPASYWTSDDDSDGEELTWSDVSSGSDDDEE